MGRALSRYLLRQDSGGTAAASRAVIKQQAAMGFLHARGRTLCCCRCPQRQRSEHVSSSLCCECVYSCSLVELHKTIHRYVVRAKRGTVQSVRDAKSGTSAPKSAGANLRRYNEAELRREIAELLLSWSASIAECSVRMDCFWKMHVVC